MQIKTASAGGPSRGKRNAATRYGIGATLLALVSIAGLAVAGCAARKTGEISSSDLVLGTVCSIRMTAGGSDSAAQAAFARLHEIEATLTVNKEGSQIDAVNAAAAPDDLHRESVTGCGRWRSKII